MEDRIIFLGDSLTEWGNWEELFPDQEIMNFGIAGNTTTDLLRRLDKIYRHKASKLFLMIGINDIGESSEVNDILSNYEKIIQRLKNERPDLKIHLISVLPVMYNKFPGSGINQENVRVLNEGIRQIAVENDISYIDLTSLFADENGNLNKIYTIDGIHLSKEGYKKWKEGITNYIKQ